MQFTLPFELPLDEPQYFLAAYYCGIYLFAAAIAGFISFCNKCGRDADICNLDIDPTLVGYQTIAFNLIAEPKLETLISPSDD